MKLKLSIASFYQINETLSKITGKCASFSFAKARNIRIIQEAINDFLKSLDSKKPITFQEDLEAKDKTPEQAGRLKEWEKTLNAESTKIIVELDLIAFEVKDLEGVDDKYFQILELFIK